ncbi:MAG: 50S ribosomal protein L22 [Chloroflexi bacterium]|jgi:large subunit ribosomal protein L22|nr:50S ribosomal protein L22 [Chloroflexota bacterium]
MAGVEVRAVARNVPGSPQKAGLVADVIRGKSVEEALNILRFLPQKAARHYLKVVQSAAANAETNFNLDPAELVVVRATADKGRTLKRYRPKARGRVGPILKRSSHLTVVVAERG